MDYNSAPFSGDHYLSAKAVSGPHASLVVCQHLTLQQDLHQDSALNLTSRTRDSKGDYA